MLSRGVKDIPEPAKSGTEGHSHTASIALTEDVTEPVNTTLLSALYFAAT